MKSPRVSPRTQNKKDNSAASEVIGDDAAVEALGSKRTRSQYGANIEDSPSSRRKTEDVAPATPVSKEKSEVNGSPFVSKYKRSPDSPAQSISINHEGQFATNRIRSTPEIGVQGEHVSAHVLILEYWYSAIKKYSLNKETSQKLIERAKLLLVKKKTERFLYDSFKKSYDTFSKSKSLLDEAAQKKAEIVQGLELSNLMMESKDLFESLLAKAEEKGDKIFLGKLVEKIATTKAKNFNVESARSSIAADYRGRLAKITQSLTNELISSSNKMTYASFPRDGFKTVVKNQHSGVEGHAIQKLSEISDSLRLNPEAKIDSSDAINKISSLFFYPRLKKDNLFPGGAKDKVWLETVKDKKYKKGTPPRDNNFETLYLVTARHIILIMNCFEGLHYVSEKMVEGFLKSVLIEQKWGHDKDLKSNSSKDGKKISYEDCYGKPLTYGDLKKGVELFAAINHKEKSFSMISQEKPLEYDKYLASKTPKALSEVTKSGLLAQFNEAMPSPFVVGSPASSLALHKQVHDLSDPEKAPAPYFKVTEGSKLASKSAEISCIG